MDSKKLFGYPLPEDFLIGTGNAAFQSEGAIDADGKSPGCVEHYCIKYAGQQIPSGKAFKATVSTSPVLSEDADVAMKNGCFFYDNYEAYIEDMKKTGQNTYRLSLAWPRIIPTGTGEVNPKGIEYYNRVINKLLACGITPFVDLWHWDLPMCLEERGGFENPEFPDWFEAYAKVCFEAFGDRVKLWSTFNELQVAIIAGRMNGRFPPYYADTKKALLAGHYALLAHFRAVRLYKSMNLGGKIGAVNNLHPLAPADISKPEDLFAAQLQQTLRFDWWTEPMLKGTYPQIVLDHLTSYRENMPEHYQEDLDKNFIKMDFLGVNYYFPGRTAYDPNAPQLFTEVESFYSQPGVLYQIYPAGLMDAVQYVAAKYDNPEMYITENGHNIKNQHDEERDCDDPERIEYIREHLRMVSRCIRAGYNVKGYYWWNDADSNESGSGYTVRFGLTWVDHETGRRRWKKSRYYFSEICKAKQVY